MDDYQKFIHSSRYARWKEEEGRRETWPETVGRYVNFFYEKYGHLDPTRKVFNSIYDSILNLDVMGSMRAVMTAGPALEETQVAGYNCCFVAVDEPTVFDEIMYVLMCGTGVGFSVESQFVSKLPIVPKDLQDAADQVIVFEDSRIGWAGGFREYVSSLYAGRVPRWDLSKLRAAGVRLKTFGGRASGPEPLADLLVFTRDLFLGARGRRLTTLECHDLVCKIADIVVVGGVRRSALISLSDLEDTSIQYAKHGRWWETHPYRALANNSAVYTSRPGTGTYMREMLALYDSQSGERGIFNREAAQRKAALMGRDGSKVAGVNPCQPAWADLLTPSGLTCMGKIEVGDKVWTKEGWSTVTAKWSSGIKPVYRYGTTAGVFYGTQNHRVVSNGNKVEVEDATSIDIITGPFLLRTIDPQDVIDGLVLGDGTVHKASNDKIVLCVGKDDGDYFDSEVSDFLAPAHNGISQYAHDVVTTLTAGELPRTYERIVPDRFKNDLDKAAGFLRGLYSANGSVVGNRITLKSASPRLIEDVQLMLNALGIRSYFTTNKSKVVSFNNGDYICKESYDLNISTDRNKFVEAIGFIQKYKNDKINIVDSPKGKTTYDIVDACFVSEEEVFDITVDNGSHTYWTGGCDVSNCGEILLRSKQFCNLAEVVLRPGDNLETVKAKATVATILGTLQASLTDFKYLSPEWKENTEEERLLGVSLTGVMDWWPSVGEERAIQILQQARRTTVEVNAIVAQAIGIPASASITCVKPSGTVSQLVDSSSGIHARYAPYYTRTVRADNNDPMCKFLKDQGVPNEPDVTKPKHTMVFSFPKRSPDGAVCTKDMTAIDQLEMWKILADEWCDHNPSTTIQVKEDEWVGVFSWMYNEWDSICGIALLPYSEHTYQQAPYQEITKEEYEKKVSGMPEIEWDKLREYETEDTTSGSQELACSSGSCEIVDIN